MPVVDGKAYWPCAGGFPYRLCMRSKMEEACGRCMAMHLLETVRAELPVCLVSEVPARWAALQVALGKWCATPRGEGPEGKAEED